MYCVTRDTRKPLCTHNSTSAPQTLFPPMKALQLQALDTELFSFWGAQSSPAGNINSFQAPLEPGACPAVPWPGVQPADCNITDEK